MGVRHFFAEPHDIDKVSNTLDMTGHSSTATAVALPQL